ncbi:MAG TPA: Z1 domain-containing protein, partial [Chitinophagaceae bacterium]|nr:Z1 domain-containing protein [Chitinophagaceae bacterium]
NLIIILSGILEDLRTQTQLRLETDVIGEGIINPLTEQQGVKGVGLERRFGVQGIRDVPQVFAITSHKSDFKKQVQDAVFSLNNRNLLVCKKNTSVLKNLLIWLSDYLTENNEQHAIPLLIIDDEADNASLNNLGHQGREYASTVNGHIRAILALFSHKTYLGYTATPFANVLQDRNEEASGLWPIAYRRNGELVSKKFKQVDNIFPEDFIELLETPSNYIGVKQIFQTMESNAIKIPLVEPVTDFAESFPLKVVDNGTSIRVATKEEIEENRIVRSPRREDPYPAALPESLKEAIECFVLGIAVRLKRRPKMIGSVLYNPHNTMLIHISRFSEWQNRTSLLVSREVEALIYKINNDLPSSPVAVYAKLERTWYKYYAAITGTIRSYLPVGYADEFLEPVAFDEIKALLPDAVKGIEVKTINNLTREKLIYTTDNSRNGKKYIAIGGNRLSRGFTLEGLTINYFIRDTNYADTLLQMGRWFGYRPGYIDCCKLFTTMESIEKFDAATKTIEELELEFKKMHREGKSPEDFILRVRTHPGVLKITRPSILKNTIEVNWSYQDTLVQTTQFEIDALKIGKAWAGMKDLFTAFPWTLYEDSGCYVTETDVTGLERFISCDNALHGYALELEQIKAFIHLCVSKGKLRKWRVAVKRSGIGSILGAAETGLPGDVKLVVRSAPQEGTYYHRQLLEKKIFTVSGKSASIISTGLDMSIWLDEEEKTEAEKTFVAEKLREFQAEGREDPEEKAKKFTKPERIYRERMPDDTGLLVIYLIDMREVLTDSDAALKKLGEENGIDITVPLIGYAIGFPKMSADIGGVYMKGRYNIEEDEPETEEFDEEILNTEDTI